MHNANGTFAYVTIGGLNEVKVFRTDNFEQVATIPVGKLPHGVWPSGDGTRVYVGLEADDKMVGIDTLTNKVIASVPIGQAPQAVAYVPNAVPDGPGTDNLMPLGLAGQAVHITMAAPGAKTDRRRRPASRCMTRDWRRFSKPLSAGCSPSNPMFWPCRPTPTAAERSKACPAS